MADQDQELGIEGNPRGDEVDDHQHETDRGPTPEEQEESLRKKYGNMVPRKPLLQKEERTYFDSADWALNKGSQKGSPGGGSQGSSPGGSQEGSPINPAQAALRLKPKMTPEALRPKLQPTPHHPVRRHSFADQVRFKP